MKKQRVIKVNSIDGEPHYIFENPSPLDPVKNSVTLSEEKIKKITKKDASKPLFLTREE
jgi:hypothetical protein